MISELHAALVTELTGVASVFLGELEMGKHAVPPRIVLVPAVERFGPPQGGRDGSGNVVQSLRSRVTTVEVHLWGEDIPGVETLIGALINALQRIAGTGWQLEHGTWLAKGQGYLTRGAACVVPLSLSGQVLRTQTFAPLDTIEITTEVDALDS